MVYPVRKFPKENTIRNVGQDANRARDCSEENSERSSAAAKDSEAQWQDVSLSTRSILLVLLELKQMQFSQLLRNYCF